MTNLKVPSLLNQISITEEIDNNIDLNKRFWRYIFSLDFYTKYINIENDFIKDSLLKIKEKDSLFISYIKDYKDINLLKEHHKFFFALINFYNKNLFNKEGIELSITRNMIFNSHHNKLAKSILEDILSLLPTNSEYSLKIYFDNEIHSALIIANYLKTNHNAFIEIDTFSKSDEQVDFGSYSVLESLDFVDRVITYNNNKLFPINSFKSFNSQDSLINSNNSTSIRFFKNACFWNKCSFCTINAQHTNVNIEEKTDKVIEKHISFLKENHHIKYIFFSDEAIEHSILVKFCKRLLEENINIKMSIRTRYEKSYDEEDIKILSQAGIKFLGIGLESASNRLNLLIQKRDFDLEIEDINISIDLFNKYNINLHQYFMIGLPSESKEETLKTLNFIKSNLINRKYFTYSANVFSLNKGSDIYKNPSKYEIELLEHDFKAQGVPFKNLKNDSFSWNELKNYSYEIYSYMFFEEDYINDKFNYGYSFWDFIDRTHIFYYQKLLFDKNPYLV